jgi:hypothetical protein
MAFKATRTFTRPAKSVPFFTFTPEIALYYKEKYDDTSKRISIIVKLSEDSLKQFSISTWIDEASYLEYINDSKTQTLKLEIDAYNAGSSITSVWTTETI